MLPSTELNGTDSKKYLIMSYSSTYLRLLSFTKQLTSHVNRGLHHDALTLFYHMQTSLALSLDPYVFPLVLKSCSAVLCPQLGTSVHAHIVKMGFLSNPFVASALVDMYGKCACIFSARKLFDEIPQRNVVVWNAMISLYTHSNRVRDALDMFDAMEIEPNVSTFNALIYGLSGVKDGSIKAIAFYWKMRQLGLKPNLITLLALLPACVGIAALNLIREIHGYSIRNDIDRHPQLGSGLLDAYGRCGCLINASNVFCGMKERDVVAWSSLISAYALHGEAKNALEIFRQMELAKVQPDDITFLAVLKACSHAGLADEALDYFTKMQEGYRLQAVSDHYSCLVDVLSRAGRLYEAYKVIQEMPVKVTAKAWGALLGACRTYGEIELAEIVGRALFEIEPDNPANYVLLARIYASVGRYDEAQRIRREMKERGVKVSPGSSWVV
ncbi:putative pentatricopeptide repeat-containing protein At1g03510 [Ricinus communis]|uniref:Pentatricopeptide repeat-containing protein, putative n=1 Tax=Ricinus communis TaxID=3988 RepID=B9RB17_RICCO|nr:putative pentatricopeptide repeat-containing protein At1g03510 [Ricinus communis]EEF51994.1 pentatricopeptide repeat-containing protein, putative [Ricinus communis]|eukprot:XP_002511392.1 putative pentatricopeptide repeat-containing protein At1g03510 [Ricinus communis]